jgi:hypothetical protein
MSSVDNEGFHGFTELRKDEVSYENPSTSASATRAEYFTNSYELRSPEFPRTPSAARPEYFTVSTPENRLDKLTLELLMNKRQYRKYLEKHNPDEYTKKQAEYDRFRKYKPQIALFIEELLNDYSISGNSEHLGNTDVQDSFHALLNSCVYFFETRDCDNRGPADTLFSSEHMEDTSNRKETPVLSAPFANVYRTDIFVRDFVSPENSSLPEISNSFWGKSISKRQ